MWWSTLEAWDRGHLQMCQNPLDRMHPVYILQKKKKGQMSENAYYYYYYQVSLCSPGWSGTHFVDQADIELSDPPTFVS